MSKHKLRCWPGCLAEVVEDDDYGSKGTRCTVIQRAPMLEEILEFNGVPAWEVQVYTPVKCSNVLMAEAMQAEIGELLLIEDRALRPIDPLDEQDEITERQEVEA